MEKDDLMGNAARMGHYLADAFKREFANEAGVKDIRGQGLMIGIELDRPCGAIMQRALDAGLMLSVTADTVVRLLPPLIITQAECDELISILVPLIKTFLAEKA
jgi:acetylornithine aminotransferase